MIHCQLMTHTPTHQPAVLFEGRGGQRDHFWLGQGNAFLKLSNRVGFGDEVFDCAILDPPYESLEKHRAVGTTTRLKHSKASSNDWFKVIPNSQLPELMTGLYRVLKPNTHCYVFCDQETLFHLKPAGEAAGFKFWKPIVWDKVNLGMGYHFRCRYEFICFFEKGKRRLNDLAVPDVLTFKRIRNGFPTEKPVELCEVLVKQSTNEGERILDPFCGSGSTGVAALRNKRRFVGIDIDPKAVEWSCRRLDEEVACRGSVI